MKTYGLIGKSLGHSFSKQYFETKLNLLGLEKTEYLNFELAEIEELSAVLRDTTIAGLNVTIPYKETVMHMIDQLSEEAQSIGAVNCIEIKRQDARTFLTGHNTDWFGFLESIKPLIPSSNKNRALVLGNGGASKAIVYALKRLQIPYSIVGRQNVKLRYSDLTEQMIVDHNFIINTTPLGTFPDVTSSPPIPYSAISDGHIAFDLVYNPEKSQFLELCEKQGASIKNGHEMLVLQAEKSWEIWNNKSTT